MCIGNMPAYLPTYLHTCVHPCVCFYIYMYIYMFLYIYICICMYHGQSTQAPCMHHYRIFRSGRSKCILNNIRSRPKSKTSPKS